jgi:hypothetical protein
MRKLALLTILLVVVSLTITTDSFAVPEDERDALMALYNSTNGPNWRYYYGWGTNYVPHCTWHGVVCEDGYVIGLRLNSNQLSGSIPPELGTLGSLKHLILNANQLSGPIPAELGNLSNLYRLYLYNNQLSGPIPAELGNLRNLEVLSLWSNGLSGPIPAELANLDNLTRLLLNENPALVCWQTESALNWAIGLDYYQGPDVVCLFVCLPVVMSADG